MKVKYQGPQHHLWQRLGPGLWQCYWCKGYCKDILEPSAEAEAKSELSDLINHNSTRQTEKGG